MYLKKIYILLFSIVSSLILCTSHISGQNFLDLDSDHTNYNAVEYANKESIVDGYSDSTFQPNKFISRGEFTKIIVNSTKNKEEIDSCNGTTFPDIALDHPFLKYICVSEIYGDVSGYSSGEFKPNRFISNEEAIKIIVNSYEFADSTTKEEDFQNHKFKKYIDILAERNALPATIGATNDNLTRGNMVEIIYRVANNITNKPSTTYSDMYENSIQDITQAHNSFGVELMKKLYARTNTDKNFFISPTSIFTTLAIAENGSQNTTQSELITTLNLNELSQNSKNSRILNLIQTLNNKSYIDLSLANAVWINRDFTIKQNFSETISNYFLSEVRSLDFNNTNSAEIINNWASEETSGKINKVIESTRPTDAMYITNAVYFKGFWNVPFDEALTTNRTFYTTKTQVETPFMSHTNKRIKYFEDDNIQSVSLPYGEPKTNNQDAAMSIIIPKDGSIQSLISNLDLSKLNNWIHSTTIQNVNLHMPKFKIEEEYTSDLKDTLIDMGLSSAFSENADFGNIFETTTENLQITKISHKTFVEVDEKGTEAAAVTTIGIGVTSIPQVKYVDLNKPFLFLIHDLENSNILFVGVMHNPTI